MGVFYLAQVIGVDPLTALLRKLSVPPPAIETALHVLMAELRHTIQLGQQKKYEVEQAQQDAASLVARERGKGEAEKANAEGQAQALRIRGAAEAEYNARAWPSPSRPC